MARIVVLSFDSNEAAESFAAVSMNDDVPYKVEAMIARPTTGCRGPHRVPGKMKPERGWSRTIRFGWFVCAVCKKPSATVVRDFIANMLGGYNNLLPELFGDKPQQPRHIRSA
jgi:hypothetical protein